jgi:hypothetical protein
MIGSGVREFVFDSDRPAFLKTELVVFGMVRYGRSEFTIIQVDLCPFMCFMSISPIFTM